MSRRRLLLAAFAAALGLTAAWSGLAAASVRTEASTGFSKAVEVKRPAHAASNPHEWGTELYGVACTSTGNCVAVGTYEDASLNEQALAVTEKGGKWGRAVEVLTPDHGEKNPFASLNAVYCTSAGNCVAVGGYEDNSYNSQLLAATEKAGKWGSGVKLSSPANSRFSSPTTLDGVYCTSAGNCVAVGTYEDTSFNQQALIVTEKGGKWGRALELHPPTGASSDPDAVMNGVSCTSTGNCVAVGEYASSRGREAMIATEKSDKWGRATVVALSTTSSGSISNSLNGIACTSAGNCVAVGSDGSGSVAIAETKGTWGRASQVIGAANPYYATLYGVACTSTGNCAAAGMQEIGGSASHKQYATAALETGGVWGKATDVTPPANTQSLLNGVTCTRTRSCVAVGSYGGNPGTDGQAMASSATGV